MTRFENRDRASRTFAKRQDGRIRRVERRAARAAKLAFLNS